MNETQSVAKRNNIPLMVLVVVIVIAAIWFFVSRRDASPEMIQPSTGDTTSSATGIPPDSLNH